MSAEKASLHVLFAGDLRALHERRIDQSRGLQPLFSYAVGEQYLGVSSNLAYRQKNAVSSFKTIIPGEYDSIPAMIRDHSESVLRLLRSSRRISEANILPIDLVLVAAATLPEEGYDGEPIPKLRNESERHQIFRLTMGHLLHEVDTGGAREDLESEIRRTFELDVLEGKDREFDELKAGYRAKLAHKLFIHRFFIGLILSSRKKTITSESITAELEEVAAGTKQREMLESEWQTLDLELDVFRQEETGKTRTVTHRQVGTPRWAVDLEHNPRVQYLKGLAKDWNGNNTDPELKPEVRAIRFRRQEKGGARHKQTDPYVVAVLPQRLPDGRIIKHAVFDSPIEGRNALFVYRGEYELLTGFNWVEVFDKSTKSDVKLFGGKKINHSGKDWKERVMDHLTLEVDKLEPVAI